MGSPYKNNNPAPDGCIYADPLSDPVTGATPVGGNVASIVLPPTGDPTRCYRAYFQWNVAVGGGLNQIPPGHNIYRIEVYLKVLNTTMYPLNCDYVGFTNKLPDPLNTNPQAAAAWTQIENNNPHNAARMYAFNDPTLTTITPPGATPAPIVFNGGNACTDLYTRVNSGVPANYWFGFGVRFYFPIGPLPVGAYVEVPDGPGGYMHRIEIETEEGGAWGGKKPELWVHYT